MGSDGKCRSESASPTIQELISQLRSSFFSCEFQNVTNTLMEREENMKKKYIEAKKKANTVQKENKLLLSENLKLNDEMKKKQKEFDELRKAKLEYEDQIRVLNSEKSRVSEKQSEIDELKKVNDDCERRVRVYKQRYLDLSDRVLILEKIAKECTDSGRNSSINLENKQQKDCAAESSRPPLFSEKGDSEKRSEPKFQGIIQIDGDDDDEDDIPILKRKRVSKETKRECNHVDNIPIGTQKRKNLEEPKSQEIIQIDDDDDYDNDNDDLEYISTLKRKRVLKETKRERDDDYVDNIPIGTQKRKNIEELHEQPLASPPLSTPRSAGIEQENFASSLDSDIKKMDELYMSIAAKIKKTRKERWECEADMLKDFDKDDELCMHAICALDRQRIQGKLSSSSLLFDDDGYDLSRITQLTELLIDGYPQIKLKKTASKMIRFDLDDCRRYAKRFSALLFNVYQNKDDPFFPPS